MQFANTKESNSYVASSPHSFDQNLAASMCNLATRIRREKMVRRHIHAAVQRWKRIQIFRHNPAQRPTHIVAAIASNMAVDKSPKRKRPRGSQVRQRTTTSRPTPQRSGNTILIQSLLAPSILAVPTILTITHRAIAMALFDSLLRDRNVMTEELANALQRELREMQQQLHQEITDTPLHEGDELDLNTIQLIQNTVHNYFEDHVYDLQTAIAAARKL